MILKGCLKVKCVIPKKCLEGQLRDSEKVLKVKIVIGKKCLTVKCVRLQKCLEGQMCDTKEVS